ncbi:MAG: hypothetical protein AAB296_01250, partial [Candidatus Desantisbacteria bacterium]
MWFSCDVRGTSTIAMRDINGIDHNLDIAHSGKGFDSEMAVAEFLWKFDNPYAIWDAMINPTLSIPHPGYNLQDLINELKERGYGFDWLLDEIGLRPKIGTVTNTNTPNPTFYFDLNNIFSGTTTIQLDISESYDFETLTYSGTPSVSFYGTSTGSHTLTEQNLFDGYYFWRIKVLNNDLPNLYSDIGMFEIFVEEPTITIYPQSGPVGTVVEITGEGFEDGMVEIDFGSHLTITTAIISNNSFLATFIVDTQPYGTTPITITADSLQLTTSFFILPSVTVKPISGAIGQEITIDGSGFKAQGLVSIDFGITQTIATTTLSNNGTFSLTFIVSTQPGGTTIITVFDTIHWTLLTIHFLITESINPESLYTEGFVGDEITFSGQGWPQNKEITIHFGTHLTITTTFTSSNGTFSTTFIADTQPHGTTIITAEGCMATGVYFIKPKIALVSPVSGNAGTIVTISGVGFANCIIAINFGSHLSITQTQSSINGTFSATFVIDNQTQGTKTITAKGISSDLATTIFYLTEAPQPATPTITAIPTQGIVGDVVTILGSGFCILDSVSIDFGTHLTITTTMTNANGTFS